MKKLLGKVESWGLRLHCCPRNLKVVLGNEAEFQLNRNGNGPQENGGCCCVDFVRKSRTVIGQPDWPVAECWVGDDTNQTYEVLQGWGPSQPANRHGKRQLRTPFLGSNQSLVQFGISFQKFMEFQAANVEFFQCWSPISSILDLRYFKIIMGWHPKVN